MTQEQVSSLLGSTGLHADVPEEFYHKAPQISNSMLAKLAKSPAHLASYLTEPWDPTPSMIEGTMLHRYILEPTRFDQMYALAPDLNKNTNKYKEWKLGCIERGLIAYDAGDKLMCEGVLASINAHPVASQLIQLPGTPELTVAWPDKESEARCRGRVDKYLVYEGQPTVVDIKTTQSAASDEFGAAAYRYRYYQQAAFYLDGLTAATGDEHTRFIIVAVEKSAPYAVATYEFDLEAISYGRTEYGRLLKLHQKCKKAERWPTYSEDIQTLSLPKWSLSKLYEETYL